MRVILILLALLFPLAATAQTASPFAVPGAPATPERTAEAQGKPGLIGWIQTKQRQFYGALREATVRLKREGAPSAGWALLFVSFVYGVFHAAGPGHGKAVISSYLLAKERAVRRGVALAWASAFAQAVTAVVLVGAVKLLFDLTARQVAGAVRPLELLSFAMVAGLGAHLSVRALRRWQARHALDGPAPSGVTMRAAIAEQGFDGHGHQGSAPHHHDEPCGHAHAPDPATLAQPLALREAAGIVAAIGVRPCSGAILVLLFTLASGIFFWGVVSAFAMAAGTALAVSGLAVLAVGAKETALRLSGPGSGRAATVLAGLELAGAGALFLIGALLFYATATSPPPPLL